MTPHRADDATINARPVIHWFRRDLRLTDNLALAAALETGAPVIPLFIFDPAILHSKRVGAPRVAFMRSALASLDASLRRHGSALLVRHGDPRRVLPALVEATGAQGLYFNRDYSPFARRRDAEVARALPIPTHSFDDMLLVPPGEATKSDGDPYTVFTAFQRKWLTIPKPCPVAPASQSGAFDRLASVDSPGLPTLADLGFDTAIETPDASEDSAHQLLARFLSGPIYEYDSGRNRLGADPDRDPTPGSSFLSPYFRFGILSIREAYEAAQAAHGQAGDARARKAVETWISELAWREFYTHILFHFPQVKTGNFRRAYDSVPWRRAPADLQAWQEGRTGYPVVDAAMRQLAQTGWMPNRARMIVASFLTKDLLIDWREGELHFMQHLIDGDLAANNGGWQWAAGTGTDAQPYFRIFNPILQGQRFDPEGVYIRRWVPELGDVPATQVHTPWASGHLPAGYPPPVVAHAFARERALAAFAAARERRPA
ncbi:MAG: DNA photolyase family protein [Anaerolineae bacterium]|nr:DNA photolyase family protein [Anaerolineae bacterium]